MTVKVLGTFLEKLLHGNPGLPHFLTFSLLCPVLNLAGDLRKSDTPHTFQTHLPFFSTFHHCSSVGQLGIDFSPISIDSIPTCLRAIKLSAKIYSRWKESKAKKLSPPRHVRGEE